MAINGVFISQEEQRDWMSFIQQQDEENAITYLDEFIKLHGSDRFKKLNSLYIFNVQSSAGEFLCNSLYGAVISKNYRLMEKLLDSGANVDEGTICKNPSSFVHHRSPLMVACEKHDEEAVKLLLKYSPNLSHQNGAGDNVLIKTTTLKICNLIIEKAISSNCIHEL